jgi:hypothetical protein
MGHLILFEEIEFGGRHRHLVAAEPDLGAAAPFAWSGGAVSFAILTGVWQLCRDAGFGRPHAPLFGPGLYVWADPQDLAEGSVASLRPVEAQPTIEGDDLTDCLTLFEQEALRGRHRHVFRDDPDASPAGFRARSALVERGTAEPDLWELHGDAGIVRLGPGRHAALPGGGSRAMRPPHGAAASATLAGEGVNGHVILFESEGFRGPHRHLLQAEPDLAIDAVGPTRIGSFAVELGAWALYREPGFREPLPPWEAAALARAEGAPPPYFSPDREGWPRLVARSGEALGGKTPRSLALPQPDLRIWRAPDAARAVIGVVVGPRSLPRLWLDGEELTERLQLRHDYDGWASLWCLELEAAAADAPAIRVAAVERGR